MALVLDVTSSTQDRDFVIAGRSYSSRLLIGTGKYQDFKQTSGAVEASGAQIVTVAIRRTNIGQETDAPNLLEITSILDDRIKGDKIRVNV